MPFENLESITMAVCASWQHASDSAMHIGLYPSSNILMVHRLLLKALTHLQNEHLIKKFFKDYLQPEWIGWYSQITHKNPKEYDRLLLKGQTPTWKHSRDSTILEHLLHRSFAKIIYDSLSELGGRGKSTKVTRANFLIL